MKNKNLALKILIPVFIVFIAVFEWQTEIFSQLHGFVVADSIYRELNRIENTRPTRRYLEATVLRKMTSDQQIVRYDIAESIRNEPGMKWIEYPIVHVSYSRGEFHYLDAFYDGKGRLFSFINCY